VCLAIRCSIPPYRIGCAWGAGGASDCDCTRLNGGFPKEGTRDARGARVELAPRWCRACAVRQWYALGIYDAPPYQVEVVRMRGATAMRKRLVRHGNSRALVIDKAILELLKIDDDTEVEMSTDGETLRIVPVREIEARRARLTEISDRIMDENDDLFRRLAE